MTLSRALIGNGSLWMQALSRLQLQVQKKTGKNPTNRGRSGSKRSILTDSKGIPLSIVVAAANIRDFKLMHLTLASIVIKRPNPKRVHQNLLADKDYSNEESRMIAAQMGYDAHIPQKENEKIKIPKHAGRRKARRWVVEQTFGALNRDRSIFTRWEKDPMNYEALLQIAAAILCFNRSHRK
jgi:putative transposase